MIKNASLIDQLRTKKPLVHNITNQVVSNFTANGLYAVGAAPVMANAVEEVAEMVQHADALVLNMGTLTSLQLEAMIIAGKAANKKGIPVVLDPVGIGATRFRVDAAQNILENVQVSLIRGNLGEISFLAGVDMKMKGVDAVSPGDHVAIAHQASRKLNVPIAVTGKQDVITDGFTSYIVENGHQLQTTVTGVGCLLTSVIAAFLAIGDNTIRTAAEAISFYGVAAQLAAEKVDGPGSFQIAFLDSLYKLGDEIYREKSNIKKEVSYGEDYK
ncbi:hydroxyethylthiazole kinase [Radiobacillus sp. PE A8.2]|uniref:hydroxyethylthiazole kinase n=1 Tax=Radiobacillus sp. PE A8.2 TaxID=3380349 RepID=UPI00388F0242